MNLSHTPNKSKLVRRSNNTKNGGQKNIKHFKTRFSRFQIGPSNIYPTIRDGQVLGSRMILKADIFPSGVQRSLPLHLSGASNFRQVPSLPVYSVAQPTGYGIRSVLNIMKLGPMFNKQKRKLTGTIPREAVWINLREEPVIYLNNRPFVLRELDHPFRNMQDFRGLDAEDINDVERRLKTDILRESIQSRGNVLLHEEAYDGPALRISWEALSDTSIKTSNEIFDVLKNEGYMVDYYRVPVTPEDVPDATDFDNLAGIFLRHSRVINRTSLKKQTVHFHLPHIIFNCQRGTGRSIMGLVTVWLLRKRLLREIVDTTTNTNTTTNKAIMANNANINTLTVQTNKNDTPSNEQVHRSFNLILKLIRMLRNGTKAKRLVDRAIIRCSDGVHSLRKGVLKYIKRAQNERDDTLNLVHLNTAATYLLRYFMLICFQNYLDTCPFNMKTFQFEHTFTTWLQGRPELLRLAEMSRQSDFWQVEADEKPLNQIEKIICARNGAVLSQRTILKAEYFVFRDESHINRNLEAPRFRVMHDIPVAATGQPTTRGIRNILERMGASFNVANNLRIDKSLPPTTKCTKILWINFREEPVLYIKGRPYVLREMNAPFRSMSEFTTGMTPQLIHNLEYRLKQDVLKELEENHNQLLLHGEQESNKLSCQYEHVDIKDIDQYVMTSAEMFAKLKNDNYDVDYERIPLTVGKTPGFASFDLLFNLLSNIVPLMVKSHHININEIKQAVCFNCFRGGRRSTMGMVVTCLMLKFYGFPIDEIIVAQQSEEKLKQQDELDDESDDEMNNNNNNKNNNHINDNDNIDIDDESDDESKDEEIINEPAESERAEMSRRRGEYKGILGLIRILPQGTNVKAEVDAAIDLCGATYNLRETISEEVFRSENQRMNATQAALRLNRATDYLESYAFLICFNSFLQEKRVYLDKISEQKNKEEEEDNVSFSNWVLKRPELCVALENIRRDADEMLKLGSFTNPQEFKELYASRCGNVLTAGSIIKNDYFVGIRSESLPNLLKGTINFRIVAGGAPIAGNGAPTALGMANLVKAMAEHLHINKKENETSSKKRHLSNNTSSNIINKPQIHGLWLNMREEPVVYLGFHPYVLREFDKPYRNIENTGIIAKRVERMETQLKLDIIEEIHKNNGVILLHDEDHDGNLIAVTSQIKENEVHTPKEVYTMVFKYLSCVDILEKEKSDQMKCLNRLNIKCPNDYIIDTVYVRMPITDEQAPSIESFDSIVKTLESIKFKVDATTIRNFFVTNCQMGRGRTTTTMILMYLWFMHRFQDPHLIDNIELPRKRSSTDITNTFSELEHSEVDTDIELIGQNNVAYKTTNVHNHSLPMKLDEKSKFEKRLLNGEYKVIQALVRLLKDGVEIKKEVDKVIDECDHMQNLRTAIYDLAVKANTAVKSRRPTFANQGIKYLTRYFFLVCYNAYFRDESKNSFTTTFKIWYESRPELQHVLEKHSTEFPPMKPNNQPQVLPQVSPTSPLTSKKAGPFLSPLISPKEN